MQIMGCVARELGFTGILTELVDVQKNVFLGCKKLSQLSKKFTEIDDIISSYNAGAPLRRGYVYINQKYVDKVKSEYEKIK
jgi:soluble lytic murein transglycosylase-like protein